MCILLKVSQGPILHTTVIAPVNNVHFSLCMSSTLLLHNCPGLLMHIQTNCLQIVQVGRAGNRQPVTTHPQGKPITPMLPGFV